MTANMVYTRMIDNLALLSQFGFVGYSRKKVGDASRNPKSDKLQTSSILQPCIKTSCTYYFLLFLVIEKFFRHVSGQTGITFEFTSINDYDCSSNIICRVGAHVYTGVPISQVHSGMLSLTYENPSASRSGGGLAFYHEKVRFKDSQTGQSASFNTSFTIAQVMETGLSGDGMTFVITSNNSRHGGIGEFFWIFNADNSTLPDFKAVVVEFDTYYNPDYPALDINGNHLSFDLNSNLSYTLTQDAAKAGVNLSDPNYLTYAWVEYSGSTNQLEARVSPNNSRPVIPLLSYTLNLSNLLDEYMWVGFSSANGGAKSNFYVGNWAFGSYGILPFNPAPSRPAPSSPTPSSPAPSRPAQSSPALSSPAPSPHKSRGTNWGLLLGTAVGIPVGLLVACIYVALVFVQRRADGKGRYRGGLLGKRSSIEEDLPKEFLEGMPERFSYKELSAATRGFSEETKLGQGGFGSVYRGVLSSSGREVAVKKIDADSTQGQKEFMAEVSIISQLRHRNLIQLCGWCKDASKAKFVIVYELMLNGSLDKVLFQPAVQMKLPSLSWSQRFKIVTGTAAALDYLHQGWKQQVIHRDVKSSNIMLDNEWNPKLGDFGLARLVDHQRAASTTLVAGTYGYLAPEAAFSGRFTDKTDVFAFGAVVLEVACGRKIILHRVPEEEVLLVDWVWKKFSENNLLSTVDRQLEGEYDTHWMEVVLTLGLLCSHPDPESRPSMRHVVQVLAGEAQVPSIPTFKPDFVWRSTRRVPSIGDNSDFSAGQTAPLETRNQACRLLDQHLDRLSKYLAHAATHIVASDWVIVVRYFDDRDILLDYHLDQNDPATLDWALDWIYACKQAFLDVTTFTLQPSETIGHHRPHIPKSGAWAVLGLEGK